MKRPLYIIFNIFYQIIICWLLVILNAFYNDLLIPERLLHSSGKVGMKILIVLVEGTILILIAYAINRAVLSDTDDSKNSKSVANQTGIVQLIIAVCFIIAVILN
jgi:hypothetical protein